MNINELLGSSTAPYKRQKEENRAVVNKWARTGLLENLSSEYEKDSIAVLLENQAKQLVVESSRTGTAEGSEEWSGVALPLVRRIFAEIAAKDFVSVQSMNLPSGLVFWLDYKYGTAQPGFQSGAGKNSQEDSVFGVTGYEAQDQDPRGGLYGAGRYGYTINDQISAGLSYAAAPGAAAYTTGSATAADWNYDSRFSAAYSASIAAGEILTVTVASASLTRHDAEGIRAFILSGSATGIVEQFPQFTRATANNGLITFVVSGSATAMGTIFTQYHRQPTDITRGDFEDPVDGTDIGIPEINMELRSEPIVAKTRKLKAIWTPEFAQDLNAYHSIDAEAELTSMLSEQISQEIDLEILDMLLKNAQTTERWSAQIGQEFDAASGTFSSAANVAGLAYTQQSWFNTLGTKIQKVSNAIHQKTLRGGANWLVCSPQVATILESIPGYSVDADGRGMQFNMGVQKVGSINGQVQVYKNPYMLENQILVGYRGSQFLETGAVYAPYIPLVMTPLVYDPTNFTPRKGIMTRYAKKVVRPEFYGLIQVDGLDRV